MKRFHINRKKTIIAACIAIPAIAAAIFIPRAVKAKNADGMRLFNQK